MFAYTLLFVFPMAMIIAAMSDVMTMKIPNWISVVLFAGFLVIAPVSGLSLELFGSHMLAGFCLLAAGIALFATGKLGGGDAKLIAAGGFWVGFAALPAYLLYIAVFGGILALTILAYRNLVPVANLPLPGWAIRLYDKDGGIPYGVAIAAGALAAFPQTVLYSLVMLG
ncbi:MAG: prepilin peptidase [Hyphomicrobiaceae bacterium]|nr:prepilin peptidase [Hyphomicrobiaceae bacterium]